MRRVLFGSVIGLVAAAFVAGTGLAQERAKASKSDATAACMDMMQGAGVTEEGKRTMREFMQSDRAPQAMPKMMEMARRMGDGDVMVGMTRMMGMMGGQGGMMGDGGGKMGGQGGVMSPGAGQPAKVAP